MTNKIKISPKLMIVITVLALIFVLFGVYSMIYIQSFIKNGIGEPGELVWYDSALANLSILYPKNWAILDTPEGSHGDKDVKLEISDYRYFTHISILSRKYDNGTLDDVASWESMRLSSTEGISSINKYAYLTGEDEGIVYEYSEPQLNFLGATMLQCKDWIFLKNNIGYIVNSCTYSEKWEDRKGLISQIVGSIIFN